MTEDDFKKLSSPRLGEMLTKIRKQIEEEEKKARYIIDTMGTFTFPAFREAFYKDKPFKKKKKKSLDTKNLPENLNVNSPQPNPREGKNKKYGKRKYDRIRSNINYEKWGPLAVAYGDYIKLLEAQERIGTSEGYFSALMSLLQFKSVLRFEDITALFLYEYERWMLNRGRSITTVAIHVRTLRAIINLPEHKKMFKDERYPFGRGRYVVPKGENTKKACELSEIKKLYEYKPEPHKDVSCELFARDMWFFGFFANGINPTDIAHLKYKNIDEDGFIIISREKTKFTTRANPKKLVIAITDDMQRIIDTWGNSDNNAENYIFPVFTHGISAHRRRELVQGFTSTINDWMKRICKKVGISKKIRTMEYRHSMATILKRAGVSTSYIKEILGHTDEKTTENYLDSFELEVKKKYSQHLSIFKTIRSESTNSL
jgi:integrase